MKTQDLKQAFKSESSFKNYVKHSINQDRKQLQQAKYAFVGLILFVSSSLCIIFECL
jgi:hypothetical protein